MSLAYQTDEDPRDLDVDQPEPGVIGRPSPPYYTYALVGAIAAVAVIQSATGLEMSMLAAGFDKPAFLHRGEYWRILTGAAVHGGLAHVLMNSYALYSFGRIFELLSSGAHLASVFLLSAIAGGVLSLIFVPEGLSVGASGGVVGLISYLAVYTFRRRQFITPEFRKSLLMNIGFIIVFGLVLFQIIDNFGHIGGLVAGAVYGFIQIPGDAFTDPRVAGTVGQIAGFASLAIYIAACLFSILLILRVV